METKLISIIVPAFQEESVIKIFHEMLIQTLTEINNYNFEIIYIDDGSIDSTPEIIKKIINKENYPIFLYKLSRNFGHQYALSCGLDHAHGDAVITMDADLQHPPELIHEFLKYFENGYDIVFTKRHDTKDVNIVKRLLSRGFYKIINCISEVPIFENAADFRLMSKKVVHLFQTEIRENKRFLRGLVSWVGFKSIAIEFKVHKRVAGKSKYNLNKMLKLACDGLVSFSTAPLKLGLYIGFLFGIITICYACYVFAMYFFSNKIISGWTSIIILLCLVSSLLFFILGLMGIYVGYIYDELKNRPIYIVEQVFSNISDQVKEGKIL